MRMTAAEQAECDAIMNKIAAENRAAEAARPAPTADKVVSTAAFLKKWAKGKPIRRQSSDATFWAAGKWMTKLDASMAQAIADAGLGVLTGNPKIGGASLLMNK